MSEQVKLQIVGMNEETAMKKIETALYQLPGLIEANVNVEKQFVQAIYEPELTGPYRLQEAIEKLGLSVILDQPHLKPVPAQLDSDFTAEPNIPVEEVAATIAASTSIQDGSVCELCPPTKQWEFPATPSLDKTWIAIMLTIPLLWSLLSEISIFSFFYIPTLFTNPWFQLLLATPLQFFWGSPYYRKAWNSLQNRQINIDVLIMLGTSCAYLYSLITLLFPRQEPDPHFETSALLITLFLVSKWLEKKIEIHQIDPIRQLIDLQIAQVTRIKGEDEQTVPLEQVVVGDHLLVNPGERIPTDGEVIIGESMVDESMIMGRKENRSLKPGDRVIAGTLNGHGQLTICVQSIDQDTILAKIIQAVRSALQVESSMQKMAQRVSTYSGPTILAISLLTLIIGLFKHFVPSLEAAIAVLVISCPCIYQIATPIMIILGLGKAAQHGIIFSSCEQYEQAYEIDTILLEKTGVLTAGKPELVDIILYSGQSEYQLLRFVGSLEKQIDHPLAHAIVSAVEERQIQLTSVDQYTKLPGYGVHGRVEGKTVTVGNRKLLKQQSINTEAIEDQLRMLEAEGKTTILIAIDHRIAGILTFLDPFREGAVHAIRRLRKMGIAIQLMTGDSRRTANMIAQTAGIRYVLADALCSGKEAEIKRLQQQGRKVAVIHTATDPVPYSTTAMQIQLDSGASIYPSYGQLQIIERHLHQVAAALESSRQTFRKVKMNRFWVGAYHLIFIPLATMGFLPPEMAGAVMVTSFAILAFYAYHQVLKINTHP
ncbi:Cu+-exporting ATPase [Seinonella peptonophila]|uniref:P-type Cu(+) transporter n=1 Tax=Seinonella peptonophila TaxID=112248 RepID=A0A1M4Z6T8_9BACL|nr:heavy metal translocating P-type ATPase [Seinonella peptonophila]SHF13720.1 Cu+-exporting ATPase [Seinonella peptonophila]